MKGRLISKTVSGAYLKSMIDGCIQYGAEADALYAMIDGGEKAFDNPLRRFPRETMITVLNTAVSLTGDQSLALKAGLQLRPNSFLDVGYALTVCDNLEDVLMTNRMYQPLTQQIGQTRFKLYSHAAEVTWRPLYDSTELYRYFVEMVFAGYAVIGRWLLFTDGPTILKMEFRHKAPANLSTARTLFGDNIIYGADVDRLSFPPELARLPLPSRNPEMKQILMARLDEQLAALGQPQNISTQVLHAIHKVLPQGQANLNHIARMLGISERSLRRRLSGEESSFRSLLETARKEACDIYLRKGGMSHTQMALSLGYSDQSAFGRAFKTWYGVSPNAYKARMSSL